MAAADYIGLTKCFHTLVLRGVPVFSAANRNEAYRRAAYVPAHLFGHTFLAAACSGPARFVIPTEDGTMPLPLPLSLRIIRASRGCLGHMPG